MRRRGGRRGGGFRFLLVEIGGTRPPTFNDLYLGVLRYFIVSYTGIN